ncbi:MAG: hypothetical protein E7049_00760 [Lentisphaerae bacterium]|nr:hypothetical protein [Lentisphaerota bacterium]
MAKAIEEMLNFKGYFLEDHADMIPENVCGVYCAYACSLNAETNKWVGTDIVYFGKSGGDVRGRVNDHKKVGDNARRTLTNGEKLLYCYAKTDNEIECEKALVAAHKDLPRLANTLLTDGYVGPKISLTIKGDCYGIKSGIEFEANKED